MVQLRNVRYTCSLRHAAHPGSYVIRSCLDHDFSTDSNLQSCLQPARTTLYERLADIQSNLDPLFSNSISVPMNVSSRILKAT